MGPSRHWHERIFAKAGVRRMPWVVPAGLLLWGLLYSNLYLRLWSRWWFEDDPFLFDYALQLANPFRAFTDPNVLRQFTVGKALVPMQILSYWIDVHIAGFVPAFAYAHQTVSYLFTLLLLYLVLLPIVQNDQLAAAMICAMWTMLPATSVVLQFLATRHYLEGMLFLLAAVYLTQRLRLPIGKMRWMARTGIFSAAIISMLYKEVYVPAVAAALLADALRYRDRRLGVFTIASVTAYGTYRVIMVGAGADYSIPFLNAAQYLRFLAKIPYTIASNYGGYCVFGIVVWLAFAYSRRLENCFRTIFWLVAVIALSLAVIVPVSYPLYRTIRTPGPWYRIVFLLNTALLCFGGGLAVRSTSRRYQIAFAAIALAALIPGAEKTRRLWTAMTASAEQEAKFYLNNPDKVLLSRQDAWWFIPGVHKMYQVGTTHYILLKDFQPAGPGQQKIVVWENRNGEFVPRGGSSGAQP